MRRLSTIVVTTTTRRSASRRRNDHDHDIRWSQELLLPVLLRSVVVVDVINVGRRYCREYTTTTCCRRFQSFSNTNNKMSFHDATNPTTTTGIGIVTSTSTSAAAAAAVAAVTSTTATTSTTNATSTTSTAKVNVLFLGTMNDVRSVQQSIIKIQQLVATNKRFPMAFTSITSPAALQYVQQLYRNNNNNNNTSTTTTTTTTTASTTTTNVSMPIHLPTMYLQDTNTTSSYIIKQQQPPPPPHGTDTITDTLLHSPAKNGLCYQLEPNLYVLRNHNDINNNNNNSNNNNYSDPMAGIWNIPIPNNNNTMTTTTTTHPNTNNNNHQHNNGNYIVVASVPPYYRNSHSNSTDLFTVTQHPSYIGCDILLSSEWPQGIETIYQRQQPIVPVAQPPHNDNKNNSKRNGTAPTIEQQQQQLLPPPPPPPPRMVLQTSYDVADIALRCRPRYHISLQQLPPPPPPRPPPPPPPRSGTTTTSSTQSPPTQSPPPQSQLQYYQSPPFKHLPSTISTRQSIHHTGRFIAICPVPSSSITTTSASSPATTTKTQKFLHAISILPLHVMNNSNSNEGNNALPNPYTDIVYTTDVGGAQHVPFQRTTTNVGVSEASARRIIAESNHPQQQQQQSMEQFRWTVNNYNNQLNNKRPHHETIDPNKFTLFIYGLQQDKTGRLQNAIRNHRPNQPNIIVQTLQKYSLLQVRYPKRTNPELPIASNYAFLDFASHQHAAICLQDFESTGLKIMGIHLTIKWATPSIPSRILPSRSDMVDDPSMIPPPTGTGLSKRLTEQEAHDSTTLYFKYTIWAKSAAGNKEMNSKTNTTTTEQDEEVSTDIQFNKKQRTLILHNNVPEKVIDKPPSRPLPNVAVACELVRQWMEQSLEMALVDDDDDGDTKNINTENRIRAVDEPALQVSVHLPNEEITTATDQPQRRDRQYGFFKFASHAAASMTLATLTGSTNGGRILEDQKLLRIRQEQPQILEEPVPKPPPPPSLPDDNEPLTDAMSSTNDSPPLPQIPENAPAMKVVVSSEDALSLFAPDVGLYLHWSNNYVQPPISIDERKVIASEDGGFKFERKHFPKDSRTDCWFCLASSTCERHLITGVYDTCYMTFPKGPVHPGHVLLVPVHHTSKGALMDATVAKEMEDLKVKLRQHASIAYNSDLFVFERAIQTQGGYHTHVQCIPIPRTLGLQLQSTMLAQGRKYGLDIREINTDLGLSSLLNSTDDDRKPDGGYFYAEIPMLGRDCKRFLYRIETITPTFSGRNRSGVNMQFGREILALVLKDPKISHWKSCVVDQEQETAMAVKFRESFEKIYIPT